MGLIRGPEPQTERGLLELLRTALPIEPEAIALIFAVRSLCQSRPEIAMQEAQEALRWAERSVLSPL